MYLAKGADSSPSQPRFEFVSIVARPKRSIWSLFLSTSEANFAPMLHPIRTCALTAALTAGLAAQIPLDTELLVNRDFETGDLTGWTLWGSSTALVEPYGLSTGIPGIAVGTYIHGGLFAVSDLNGGNARYRQVFDLRQNSRPLAVRLSGYFGGLGSENDSAVLEAIFLDAQGIEIPTPPFRKPARVGGLGRMQRNDESVLMADAGTFEVPAAAATMIAQLRFLYFGGSADGCADNLSVELTRPTTPSPQPIDVQMLRHTDFEQGWAVGSPLQLNDPRGWRGAREGRTLLVEPYGTGEVPGLDVATTIGGGVLCVSDLNGGSAVLSQSFDLRGNAGSIQAGALAIELDGYFGGLGSDDDSAGLFAVFRNALDIVLSEVGIDGSRRAERNDETILQRRTGVFQIPLNTTVVDVELRMRYTGGRADGVADNLAMRFVRSAASTPLPLDVELLENGDFEGGWIASSPLQLVSPRGWLGAIAGRTVRVDAYGSSGAPPTSVATRIGGGAYLLGDLNGGSAILRQQFDLRGNATMVRSGLLGVRLSGFFGGFGNDADTAFLDVGFYDANDGFIRTDSIGGSAAVDDLEYDEGDFVVPTNAARCVIELRFLYTGGSADGAADNVSVILFDSSRRSACPIFAPFGANYPGGPFAFANDNGYFANVVISNRRGTPGSPNPEWSSPQSALGAPDYSRVGLPHQQGVGGVYSTGHDGDLVVGFWPRRIVNSGDPSPEVFVFEGGNLPDRVFLSARPANEATRIRMLQIGNDPDGDGFYELGANFTSSPAHVAVVDIDAIFPNSAPATLSFDLLKVRDDPNHCPTGNGCGTSQEVQPGAEIDAIGIACFGQFASANFPGTNEDLLMFTGIDGRPPSTGPAFDIKSMAPGGLLTLRVASNGGAFDFAPLLLLCNITGVGSPIYARIPGIALDPLLPILTLAQPGPFGAIVAPEGTRFDFAIPTTASGSALLLQAFALPQLASPPYNPAPAANGAFVGTDGHLINFR
jgi:hypothetical protein